MPSEIDVDWLPILKSIPGWPAHWRDDSKVEDWASQKGYSAHDLWHVAMWMVVMSVDQLKKYRDLPRVFQVYVMKGWGMECNCRDRKESDSLYQRHYPANYKGIRYY